MKSYEIQVCRTWLEYGTITVEADDEDHARDIFLTEASDDEIEWDTDNMDPQGDRIESVVEVP